MAVWNIPAGSQALAPVNEASESAYVRFEPWDVGRELNLWQYEKRRFYRSDPVLSPDRSLYAYSEVLFMPDNRQTFSKLYLVAVPPLPDPAPPLLPSETPPPPEKKKMSKLEKQLAAERRARTVQDRYNPNKTLQQRQLIQGVGHDRIRDFEFRTLTIIDWSASGNRLLFKQRSGMQHLGLKTSDILVYDRGGGTVTLYPEIQRILERYWNTHNPPPADKTNATYHLDPPQLDTTAWDIYPLGWAPGSDSLVVFEGWAYYRNDKRYLGLWHYDMDAGRAQLISLEPARPAMAANGWVAVPIHPYYDRKKR